MANGWTLERRARQPALIRTWQPWEQSNGPKTEEGKAVAARNSWKHGARSADAIAELQSVLDLMREFRDFRAQVMG